jgi:hypothetical protein
MLPFGVVRSWPRGWQYGIRALIVLAVLLPLSLVGSRLGNGSMTITENAATSTTTRDATTAPDTTVRSGPTLPGGTATTTGSTTAGTAQAPAGSGPATSAAPGPGPGQPAGAGSGAAFEGIRNRSDRFSRFADVPSGQLDINALTVTAGRSDNGSVGEGQFRIACEYSHFNYDDPIVFPGQPGQSHLHMFFGNTRTDAFTTTDSLVNSGGGTCNGFELNRSAYWLPALLDGKGNIVAPRSIIVYYKTKDMANAIAIPQGLRMIAGNPKAETFTASHELHWSCGGSGASYNQTNRIPDCGGDTINATVAFPNCWDGRNLDSADHTSHTAYTPEGQSCPASHPVRIPQVTYLLYWSGTGSVDGWHLSSDRASGFNSGPGATLHADWFGGWNQQTTELWTNGCIKPARNCSFGQTGTGRQLAPLNGLQEYEGPTLLPLPAGAG